MNTIIHLPTTEKGIQKLKKKVNEQHARIVAETIINMKCSEGDKDKLLETICYEYKKDCCT